MVTKYVAWLPPTGVAITHISPLTAVWYLTISAALVGRPSQSAQEIDALYWVNKSNSDTKELDANVL